MAALRTGLAVFTAAVTADLVSKALVVHEHGVLIWNDRPGELPRRVAMCAAAIVVAAALTRLAAWRGLGRLWGLWAGCALLVAGVLANGVSPLLWPQGVPDFLDVGDGWVWCLADFEIGLGLVGGVASVGMIALVAYGRHALAR